MSLVYLFRHGQAGTRDNYDRLSDKGCRQAGLLGKYLRESGLHFRAAYAGDLERQRQTARMALDALPAAPALITDTRWNEFNLEGLWRHLGSRLMQERPEFARNFERLHRNNPNIDRIMTVCDVELIRTWTSGRTCDGMESWADFRARVTAPAGDYSSNGEPGAIAVFTSATPTSIWSGTALGLEERGIMKILSVLINTSFTTFRVENGAITLLSLNNTPHLTDPDLRTLR